MNYGINNFDFFSGPVSLKLEHPKMEFPKSNDYKFENPIVGLKKLSGDSKGAIKFMRKDLTLSGTFYHNQHN